MIEAGLGGRYDATNVIPSGAGADQRRAGAHPLAGPDADRHRRARSSTWSARRRHWCSAPAWTRRCWRWPSAWPPSAGPDRAAGTDPGVRGRRPGRLPAPQLRAGARGGGGVSRRRWIRAVAAAAAEVRVPGRLQQIDTEPLTLLDVAHNPEGMRALAESLPELGPRPMSGSWPSSRSSTTRTPPGCWPGCCRRAMRWSSPRSQNPRALPPPTLQSLARQLDGPPAEIVARPAAGAGPRARTGRARWRRHRHRLPVSDRRSAGAAPDRGERVEPRACERRRR